MNTSKSFFLAGGALVCAAVLVLIYFYTPPMEEGDIRTIHIDNVAVKVRIADTSEARTQGLSGHPGLLEDEGMLFIFDTDGRYSFWMKDMRFSIDILWISAGQEVVGIERAVAPETFPQTFTPDSDVRYVLEVPAGFSDRHGIDVGSHVVF